MAWYYNRIYPLGNGTTSGSYKATVAPAGATRFDDYEFIEITDPNVISNLNQIANASGPLFGPYASLSDAQKTAAQFPPETLDQSMLNSRTNVPVLTPALNAASGVVSTGINATGAGINLINALTQASTWIRIAEVVLGLVLIAVGVAHLTNAVPIATKTAATAAKIGKVFT